MVTVAYLLTIVAFPIRAIGWLLGEFPRSVVGYRRAKAVLDGDRLDGVRRRRAAGAPGGRAVLEVEDLHYAYDPDDAACSTG